jgi:hypothetical protein
LENGCFDIESAMPVSSRVREIESEIDANIRQFQVWRLPKQTVLEQVMQTYRDAMELVFLEHLFLRTCPKHFVEPDRDIGILFAQECRWRAGALWAVKWASEFCSDESEPGSPTPEQLVDLIDVGATYETLVDALKRANYDLLEIEVNEGSRTLSCYEGRQASAFDASIVEHQRATASAKHHVSLTNDDDQITARWKAGDYRRVLKALADKASSHENDICIDLAQLGGVIGQNASVPQPTLVWLDRPVQSPDCQLFDDLVLPTDTGSPLKWKLVTLLDTPIVKIGERYCAVSSDLKAIAHIDDYMLRLAARVDENRYTIAAALREDRMITSCKLTLEERSPPWTTKSNVIYSNPAQEADILATRGADDIVIELKSTLRPETPWEVLKRNEDVITGIRQARALVERGVAKQAFVLTDGYRGDYACWAEAAVNAVPVGTLDDLEVICDSTERRRI